MIVKAREGALLRVPTFCLDMPQVGKDLTVRNISAMRLKQKFPYRKIQTTVQEWREDGANILVPRAYSPALLPGYQLECDPWVCRGEDDWPQNTLCSRISLRDYQIPAFEAIVGKEGILDMACGRGKTSIALHTIAAEHRLPVLVAVHTSELQRQWLDRIETFLDVRGKVGVVGGGKATWKGCPLVVGLMQSLSQRRWPPEFYNYFARIVIDEAHRAPAETWSEIFRRFPGRRLCLTATVERADGMHKLLTLHAGAVLYSDDTQDLHPQVFFMDLGCRVKDRGDPYTWPSVLTQLAEHEARNTMILGEVDRALQAGRHILVLGERVLQLQELHRRTGELAGLVIGEIPAERRRGELEKRVVFASTKLAREGLDMPSFDTLFCLCVFKDVGQVKQAVGRILRKFDGKKSPLVLIFEDLGNATERMMALGMRKCMRSLRYDFISVVHGKAVDNQPTST